jgi:plasmid maintenance system antidote protein VapI
MNKVLKSMIVLKYGSQDDFAERIGVSRSVVSNVIRGRHKLSDEKKIVWATALGCCVGEIFPINHEIQKQVLGNTLNDSDSPSNQKEETAYEK